MTKPIILLSLILFLTPSLSFAVTPELAKIYETRGDLQTAFAGERYQAVPGSGAGFLIDLEDWARQYGWSEYPELASYTPPVVPARAKTQTLPPATSSLNYIVIDNASGTILAAQNADVEWPIASITKLATARTAVDNGLDYFGVGSIEQVDDVGGAKLHAGGGTKFHVLDLLKATVIASANNAANAVARLTGVPKADFVGRMNEFADELNLGRTQFTDPSGIEKENVSTAREAAAMAMEVFKDENIRRMAGTSWMNISAIDDENYVRNINNTNWLLYDSAYDDVYVTAGKTGYLHASKWNLVVRMHPMGDSFGKSVVVVVMGADGRRESFDDAANLARWAWRNYDWSRSSGN